MTLWHFTCSDAAPLIDAAGVLRPNEARTLLPEPLVWLTDLDNPSDLALGLRGVHVRCDRMAHRYEVTDATGVERWCDYARRTVRAGKLSRLARETLDMTPGGFPAHWYVSTGPVPVRRADR